MSNKRSSSPKLVGLKRSSDQSSPRATPVQQYTCIEMDYRALQLFAARVHSQIEDLRSEMLALENIWIGGPSSAAQATIPASASGCFAMDDLEEKLTTLPNEKRAELAAELMMSVRRFLCTVPDIPKFLPSRARMDPDEVNSLTSQSPGAQQGASGTFRSASPVPSQQDELAMTGRRQYEEYELSTSRKPLIDILQASNQHTLHLQPFSGPYSPTTRARDDPRFSRTGRSVFSGSVASLINPYQFHETTHLVIDRDDDGNKCINKYVTIHTLGKGSCGKVKLAQNIETNEAVAIKIIRRSLLKRANVLGISRLAQFSQELAIMKKLHHKNIVQLYEIIDDPSADKMYIVMQFVDQGPIISMDATGRCNPLDEATVAKYTRGIISGLEYLHRHNIVHRDIKPDNILLDRNNNVYLADFGVSEMFETRDMKVVGAKGTPAFFSPELCRGEGSIHGKAVDVWALGITLYAMLLGEIPFKGDTMEVIHKIQNESLPFPPDVNPIWKDLLSRLLNKDPSRRIALRELRRHPWLVQNADPLKSPAGAEHENYEIVRVNNSEVARAILHGRDILINTQYNVNANRFVKAAWAMTHYVRYCRHLRSSVNRAEILAQTDGKVGGHARLRSRTRRPDSPLEIPSPVDPPVQPQVPP